MTNSRIGGKLGISVIVATVFMLGTTVVTAAMSVSDIPTGPTRAHLAITAGIPIATSGNNLFMAWTNNDTGPRNVFFAEL
jgi:hypothetical protein